MLSYQQPCNNTINTFVCMKNRGAEVIGKLCENQKWKWNLCWTQPFPWSWNCYFLLLLFQLYYSMMGITTWCTLWEWWPLQIVLFLYFSALNVL